MQKARIIIDSLDKQFAQHFYNGDSISLYNMYAKGASLGNKRGNEILLSWGQQIRNSIKNDTRTIIYTTTSLSTDSEFLVELGIYEFRDSKGNLKHKENILLCRNKRMASGNYIATWVCKNLYYTHIYLNQEKRTLNMNCVKNQAKS
ncbi:MAG: hypothetical protein IPN39_12360 [Chitinophagaceae bacterium]|nr:hypothetical protein [Chitinophagaceae bacterium]